ncbi:hypothetical protein Pmar_PMAR011753 [Perkinsus marinus ATCC 50983]|uniref:Uncharacterized protein n=1 Tax=Perkinsus marinus (strain ATCC 50983 / TXsc) TaxID=423536 RepID=C5LCM4_PERM5|nr:hypothetical protein Pmar_PMAR011753 [Perkinsus marinus ATCC 50983]EER05707.1 hypothetical protein Pmar_PMAR011753 [Perkinsus marinus ATCC 50983]|eukprot:XP_002773891.1 hypothetical protein Pmar_PMAR011753 [Perkinsus marinus ATCC 50983]
MLRHRSLPSRTQEVRARSTVYDHDDPQGNLPSSSNDDMVPQHSTVGAGPEIYVEHNDVLVLPVSNGISGCLDDKVNDKHSIGSIVTGNSNALFNGKDDSSSGYPDRMHCTPTFGNDSSSAVPISDGCGLRGSPINLGTSGDISDATNGKSVSTPKNDNSGDDSVPQPSASSSSGFKTIEADSTTPLEGNGDSSNISGNDDLANSSKKTVATAVPSAVNVLNGNGISSPHLNTTAQHSTGPVNTTMPVTPIVHQGLVQPTNPIIDGSMVSTLFLLTLFHLMCNQVLVPLISNEATCLALMGAYL